jgi:hypothetical protein
MTLARHLITRLHGGYIAWRGRSVEHFSFPDNEKFEAAAIRLAEHCEMLEAKGFPVTPRTCMFRSLFREAPAGTPWLEAMTSYYTVLADSTGRARRCILALPGHAAVAIGIDDGHLVMDYAYETDAAFGTTNLLHELQAQGFVSCGSSDCSYDRLVELFVEAGLTPDLVRAVLATPAPEQHEQLTAEAPV